MKYEMGQMVEVVKALGEKQGYEKHRYYHGQNTGNFPLGTKGEVTYIDRNLIELKIIVNNREHSIAFHPNELAAPNLGKEKFEGMNGDSIHPVFEIAKKTPIFILNSKVYTIGEDPPNGNFYEKKRKTRKSIVEIEKVSTLDELVLGRLEHETAELEKEYVEEIMQRTRINEILKGEGDLDTPQLIYKSVFPYMGEEKYGNKLAKLIGGKVNGNGHKETNGKKPVNISERELRNLEKIADEAFSEISGIIKQIEKEGEENKRKYARLDAILGDHFEEPKENSLLGKALHKKSIALIGNKVYDLTKKRGKYQGRVKLGEQKWYLKEQESLKALEKRYEDLLSKRLRISALRKNFTKEGIIDRLKDQVSELSLIKGMQEFSEADFGFTSKEKTYYAFIEIPQFAIRSQFDEFYYLFEKSKCGFNVRNEGNRLGYSDHFCAIENNNHPFLHNKTGAFAPICTGYQEFPTDGKNNGEVIAKRLRRLKEMMMFGYTNTSYYGCYKLRKECSCGSPHFKNHIKELSELKKMDIPIVDMTKRKRDERW
ncbi:hypothetical protein ACFLZZ_00040 [Nanoarchaeota archaeon]